MHSCKHMFNPACYRRQRKLLRHVAMQHGLDGNRSQARGIAGLPCAWVAMGGGSCTCARHRQAACNNTATHRGHVTAEVCSHRHIHAPSHCNSTMGEHCYRILCSTQHRRLVLLPRHRTNCPLPGSSPGDLGLRVALLQHVDSGPRAGFCCPSVLLALLSPLFPSSTLLQTPFKLKKKIEGVLHAL
jgi:hypothetical protein